MLKTMKRPRVKITRCAHCGCVINGLSRMHREKGQRLSKEYCKRCYIAIVGKW